MGLLGDILTLLLVEVFYVGVWGSLLVTEFYGVIHAMKEAQTMGLTNVWFECDSALVCVVFTAMTNVLWMLHNRWNTCVNYRGKIGFRVTHFS